MNENNTKHLSAQRALNFGTVYLYEEEKGDTNERRKKNRHTHQRRHTFVGFSISKMRSKQRKISCSHDTIEGLQFYNFPLETNDLTNISPNLIYQTIQTMQTEQQEQEWKEQNMNSK